MIELGMRYQPWMADAPCSQPGAQPDMWHAEGWNARLRTKWAKKVCRTECPFRRECLAIALEVEGNGPRHGVWGGLDPDERAVYARRSA